MKLSIVTKKKYSSYNKEYYFHNIVQNILKLAYTSRFSFDIKVDITYYTTKNKLIQKSSVTKKYFNREKFTIFLKINFNLIINIIFKR